MCLRENRKLNLSSVSHQLSVDAECGNRLTLCFHLVPIPQIRKDVHHARCALFPVFARHLKWNDLEGSLK